MFSGQIEQIVKIRDFLQDEAPRNNDNEVQFPYSRWIQLLNRQIEKAENWVRVTSGKE